VRLQKAACTVRDLGLARALTWLNQPGFGCLGDRDGSLSAAGIRGVGDTGCTKAEVVRETCDARQGFRAIGWVKGIRLTWRQLFLCSVASPRRAGRVGRVGRDGRVGEVLFPKTGRFRKKLPNFSYLGTLTVF
jgi:hypothetical protein